MRRENFPGLAFEPIQEKWGFFHIFVYSLNVSVSFTYSKYFCPYVKRRRNHIFFSLQTAKKEGQLHLENDILGDKWKCMNGIKGQVKSIEHGV